MRDIEALALAELSEDNLRYIYLVDLQFDSGSLAFNSTLSVYTWNSTTFLGAGNLGSVSNLSESSTLDPSSCSVSLSGINDALLSAILAEEYLNRPAIIYIAMLDSVNQIIGTPFILFDALMDGIAVEYGKKSTITVSCKDRLSAWDRRKVRLWTDAEQKAKYPLDKGFEHLNFIADKEIIWPDKGWNG
jgi:hypothetical protein